MYHGAAKIVKPKMDALKVAEAKLSKVRKRRRPTADGLEPRFAGRMVELRQPPSGVFLARKA